MFQLARPRAILPSLSISNLWSPSRAHQLFRTVLKLVLARATSLSLSLSLSVCVCVCVCACVRDAGGKTERERSREKLLTVRRLTAHIKCIPFNTCRYIRRNTHTVHTSFFVVCIERQSLNFHLLIMRYIAYKNSVEYIFSKVI